MSTPSYVAVRGVGPVTCGAVVWRFRGQVQVTVVVKATFGIVNGSVMTVEPPDALRAVEAFYGGDPARSVSHASDRSPYRKRADILLTGHACAPAGAPVFATMVRLIVARGRPLLEKAFQVVGDRTTGSPTQFVAVPLVYERAFGGPGWAANPVGTGALSGTPPPNLVDPSDAQRTVCFGPIARSWPERARLLGSSPRAAIEGAVLEIPNELDFDYFQDAPPDQQVPYLIGDEQILLEGMSSTWPELDSQLPGARAVGKMYGFGAAPERGNPIALKADHLHIDADRGRCSVSWRASVPVADESILPRMLFLVGVEIAGQSLDWPDPAAVLGEMAAKQRESAPAPAPVQATVLLPASAPMQATVPLSSRESATVPLSSRESAPVPLSAREPAPSPSPPPARESAPAAPPAAAPRPAVVVMASPFEGTFEFSAEDRERVLASMNALPFTKSAAPAIEKPPSAAPPPPAPPAAPPAAAPPRRGYVESPFAATMTMSTEEAQNALAASPLPFKPVPVPAPQVLEAAPIEPSPVEPSQAPSPAGPPVAPPSAPSAKAAAGASVRASKFFHDVRRAEETRGVPERTSDVVPVVYELPHVGRGPLATFTVPWQLKPPKYSLTVGIKATFDIVPGGAAKLRDEADLPSGDVFVDDDPKKSLLYASDFAVFKARADVTLTGHAFAPGGAAAMAEVRFKFGASNGGFERRIAVFGERVWRWTGGLLPKPTDPVPFKKVALRYENAFGGEGFESNPVGLGFLSKGMLPAGVRVPHLEDPSALLIDPSATPNPMSFGPIPLVWNERWSKAGTYNEKWVRERWPFLPEDADWSIMQAAPYAQQVEPLRGDEPFEIAGMHPSQPVIRGTLPKVRVRAFAQKARAAGGEFEELRLQLDTASFDVDEMKVSLLWRGLIEVSDDDAPELDALFVFTEDLASPPSPRSAARSMFMEALDRARAASEGPRAPTTPSEEERATPAPKDEPAPKDAPAASPDADAIADRLRRAGVSEAEVSSMLQALRGDGPSASPKPAAPAQKPPPIAPPDAAAMAAGLRTAGVSEAEIASLMKGADETAKRTAEGGAPIEAPRARVLRMMEAGEPLDGLELADADLSAMNLAKASMIGVNLKGANLRGSNLDAANLSSAQLSGADLTDASLEEANVELADFFGVTLSGASLRGARVTRADFTEAACDRAGFQGVRGKGARFAAGVFTGARFEDASLESADFSRAILDGASFQRAALPDVRLHGAKGVKVTFDEASLPGARADGAAFLAGSFRGVAAPGSIWNKAELDDATFFGAVLRRASFYRAKCRRATFSAADLAEARLDRAKLAGARFLKSNLMASSLQQAELLNADLRGANMYACNAWRASLSGALLDLANVTKSTLKART